MHCNTCKCAQHDHCCRRAVKLHSFIHSHINYLSNKCQLALHLLRVVSNMDWGADRKVLLRLYRSLVRSKLDPPAGRGDRIRRLPSCRVVKPHQWTRLFAVGGDS